MATRINERLSRDIDAQSSGIIVNTCGWIDAEGYDLLLHAIKAFSIDIVLVMNHDKLYSNLVTSLDPAVTTTVKLPRSGGVVQRVRRVFVSLIFICSDDHHHHPHHNHYHIYHHQHHDDH
jgi:polyribonucleotide 5'-hydroxyl-kinase